MSAELRGEVPAEMLVVGDHRGRVEEAARAGGAQVRTWRRLARGGAEAVAWPGPGLVDGATVRLPSGKDALRMALHAVAARVRREGRAWVYGANDEGIRSATRVAAEVFRDVETARTQARCRVLRCTRPADGLRSELADWATACSAQVAGQALSWVSYPGVFAHGRVDEGSALLIEHLPTLEPGARVLDFGCGAGLLSLALLGRTPDLELTLLDIDAVAAAAARRNLPGAEVRVADGFALPRQARFDAIVSNPPLHRGKARQHSALEQLVEGARKQLEPGGELRMVVPGNVRVHRLLEVAFADVQIAARTSRYRVWSARSPISQTGGTW